METWLKAEVTEYGEVFQFFASSFTRRNFVIIAINLRLFLPLIPLNSLNNESMQTASNTGL
jgi:hypothetical protein